MNVMLSDGWPNKRWADLISWFVVKVMLSGMSHLIHVRLGHKTLTYANLARIYCFLV